jgi:hypothetical protein
MMDFSEVVLDPMLAHTFNVNRRVQVVNNFGQVSYNTQTTYNVPGVVTAAGPNDLERLDDNQRMGRNLVIVTAFRLRGPAPGYQPDTIVWGGDTFVVKTVDPYPQFGSGFVQVIAGSIDSQDQPP